MWYLSLYDWLLIFDEILLCTKKKKANYIFSLHFYTRKNVSNTIKISLLLIFVLFFSFSKIQFHYFFFLQRIEIYRTKITKKILIINLLTLFSISKKILRFQIQFLEISRKISRSLASPKTFKATSISSSRPYNSHKIWSPKYRNSLVKSRMKRRRIEFMHHVSRLAICYGPSLFSMVRGSSECTWPASPRSLLATKLELVPLSAKKRTYNLLVHPGVNECNE